MEENHVKPYVILILTDGYFGTVSPDNRRCLRPHDTVLCISNESRSPEYAKTAAYTEDTAGLGQTFGDEIWFKDAVAESKRISAAQGEQGRVTVVFNGRKEAILKKLILMND